MQSDKHNYLIISTRKVTVKKKMNVLVFLYLQRNYMYVKNGITI